MARYIAFLRGINVGGNKKVAMPRLKQMLEGLGFTQVATLLQSGNAVFTSRERTTDGIARKIEAAIPKTFGFEVSVIVRTRDELATIVAKNPLDGAAENPSHFLVTFFSTTPDKAKIEAIDEKLHQPDEFHWRGREIYARFPNGIGRSKLASIVTSPRLGAVPTARNWTTVTKLLALADAKG
jgi:uncharacterized protein (DUF1697 family)